MVLGGLIFTIIIRRAKCDEGEHKSELLSINFEATLCIKYLLKESEVDFHESIPNLITSIPD